MATTIALFKRNLSVGMINKAYSPLDRFLCIFASDVTYVNGFPGRRFEETTKLSGCQMKRTKETKGKTQDSTEKPVASNDQNLGFPLFGLSLKAGAGNLLVCAGGGGGAGRTGIGNGFSLYNFRSANGQGEPVLQLWRSCDTGEDSIGHLQLHPSADVVACGTGNKCVTYSFGDGE